MEWTKVSVETTAYGAEIVTAVLMENNISGAEIINPRERTRHLTETAHLWDYAEEYLFDDASGVVSVVFYVLKNEQGASQLNKIKNDLSLIKENELNERCTFEVKMESADDETWLNEWKKYFKPIHIDKITVVPEWVAYEKSSDDEIVFTIDPGSAFGTGQHQTTQLCISALQEYMKPGDSLIDIGCGSGILSVIGLLLGAGSVFACDIDPAGAMAATKKNAALNPIDLNRLHISSGDALSDNALRDEIRRKKYDIVTANIVADVIIGLVPFVTEILKPGGIFIASGIIGERENEVVNAFNENNLTVIKKPQLEGWVCIVGKA